MYACHNCKKTFRQVHWSPYREYPGASTQKEPVSPCCSADYTELEEEDSFSDSEEEQLLLGIHKL